MQLWFLVCMLILMLNCSEVLGPVNGKYFDEQFNIITVFIHWECDNKESDLYIYENDRLIAVTFSASTLIVKDTIRCIDGTALTGKFVINNVIRKRDTAATDSMVWLVKL